MLISLLRERKFLKTIPKIIKFKRAFIKKGKNKGSIGGTNLVTT